MRHFTVWLGLMGKQSPFVAAVEFVAGVAIGRIIGILWGLIR